jgi:hypothetical protein
LFQHVGFLLVFLYFCFFVFFFFLILVASAEAVGGIEGAERRLGGRGKQVQGERGVATYVRVVRLSFVCFALVVLDPSKLTSEFKL